MDEIVKKLGHGVRLKIEALADGYAAEFDREDLDETDLCSLAAAWRDDLYALGEEIVETATRAAANSQTPVTEGSGGGSRCSMYAAEFNDHENSLLAAQTRLLLATLLREEADEALEALTIANAPLAGHEDDLLARQHLARELADVVYVCFTGAWAFGIDLDAALAEIHRAAMDKVRANVRREDGKIVKPPGFVPPSMDGVVA